MSEKILVGIVDDHRGIIDGYLYRFVQTPAIQVNFTLGYGAEIQQMLTEYKTDVLLLDIMVPTSPDNPRPYPILSIISEALHQHPTLSIIVITMFCEKSLIKEVMEAGASGYILKDDRESINQLGEVISSVASGKTYLSRSALLSLDEKDSGSFWKIFKKER